MGAGALRGGGLTGTELKDEAIIQCRSSNDSITALDPKQT
jgi:hypothetical protein